MVETGVSAAGAELLVIVYDPAGKKARGFQAGGLGNTIRFFADFPGLYRLEISNRASGQSIRYTITVTQITPLAERLDPLPPQQYESPRIKALTMALDRGRSDATGKFWQEVAAKGAPLVEPFSGDAKNMLVTFLWRGNAYTKNVMILWTPFSYEWPDEYRMTQLRGTDVWFKTMPVSKQKRFIYQIVPNAPAVALPHNPLDDPAMAVTASAAQLDPLNPKRIVATGSVDVPQYSGMSLLEMPDDPPQPWVAQRSGVPVGKVEKYKLKSDLLNNERNVYVYTPPGYSKSATPYGIVVLFDAFAYFDTEAMPTPLPAPTILDNLISENRIPPVVAIFVGNGPGNARNRELACNPQFAEFVKSELMSWAHNLYNLASEPSRATVGGLSEGGLAAAYVGLRDSNVFGNVLSLSGAFWWLPPRSNNPTDFDPNGEPDWLPRQFAASSRVPLRFYLDAGSDELDFPHEGILNSTRHMRDVLLAKDYEVQYNEFDGGHDYLSWREDLADGLIALIGTPNQH